ncbi:MAG: hypothetical protein WC713_05870 [Candidatus Methylomirabilota bacterium]
MTADESQPTQFPRRYIAEPTLAQFHADDTFIRGVRGPRGCGKSVAMCMEIISRAKRQPPAADGRRISRWGVIRNTYPELRSTTIQTWSEWVDPALAPVVYSAPITCHVRFQHPDGDGTVIDLQVLFVSCDKPRDLGKLLSLELTGVWVNEAREVPKAVIEQTKMCVGRWPRKGVCAPYWSGIIMDTNPPNIRNWWYEMAEVQRPPGWRFWHQPPALVRLPDGKWAIHPDAENIQNHPLGPTYWMRAVHGAEPEWIKAYLLGEYANVFDGRPVYEAAYSDDVHSAVRPLGVYRGLPLWLGWDFGLDPACCAVQIAPNGQRRVLREWVGHDIALRQFVSTTVKPALLNEFAGMTLISRCDPAGTQRAQTDETTCVQMLGSLGIPTEAAPSNDWLPRREAVLTCLQRRIGDESGLLLDPSCTVLREGFLGGYQYARVQSSGEERYRDEPLKNYYSHCIAKGQMVQTMRGDVRIEDVRPGDEALTPSGYCAVSRAWCVDDFAEVIQVVVNDGRSVVLTPDHLVLSNGLWTRADALQYNDILESVSSYNLLESRECRCHGSIQYRSSMGFCTTEADLGGTLLHLPTGTQDGLCTVLFGSSTTAQSHPERLSRMLTGICRTTGSRTCDCLCPKTAGSTPFRSSMELGTTESERGITRRPSAPTTAFDTCTGTYGNSITARCPPARKYTTRTETRPTTPSRISNYATDLNTTRTILESTIRNIPTKPNAASWQLERPQRHGMHRMPGDDGTLNTENERGRTASWNNASAFDAGSPLPFCAVHQSAASVLRRVSQRLVGHLALMTKIAPALCAESRIAQTSTLGARRVARVVRIRRLLQHTSVYDLTVDEAHCFYVNGILVHNCHDALQYALLSMDEGFRVEHSMGRAQKEVVHVV